MPCDITTLATDAPGSAHSGTICAFIAALYSRRVSVFSLVIVSTYKEKDTILADPKAGFKMTWPDAYGGPAGDPGLTCANDLGVMDGTEHHPTIEDGIRALQQRN